MTSKELQGKIDKFTEERDSQPFKYAADYNKCIGKMHKHLMKMLAVERQCRLLEIDAEAIYQSCKL